MGLTIEHIDPKNGVLVSGLSNEFNEVLCDQSYNSRKNNRFVPYRVCDYPAPITFGDTGEFLIGDQWVVCEFGGPEWWIESNIIGNAHTKCGNANTPAQQRARREVGIRNSKSLNSHPNTRLGRIKSGNMNTPAQQKARKENGKALSSHPNTIATKGKGGKANSPKQQEARIKWGETYGKQNSVPLNFNMWVSTIDGFVGNAGNVAQHNKRNGWDPGARVQLKEEGWI